MHNYQKRWVFTWNINDAGWMPKQKDLSALLDIYVVSGVFQLELGLTTARPHYQGRFELKGSRLGKKRLLEIFRELGDTSQLTFQPEIVYDSTSYCTKSETREAGPWYVGTNSYKTKQQPLQLELRMWQEQLLAEMAGIDDSGKRDRKVIWIQDILGGAGKSTFSKYLSFGQKDWKVKKLPLDKPDRLRMAVCKIVQKEDVDVFTFDFTRTRGEETSMNNLFQIIEEIKNAHVVSVMYGNPMEVGFTSPHVIIFTNEKLEDYEKYLSPDRWAPYTVQSGKLYHMTYNPQDKAYGYSPVSEIRNIKAQEEKPEPTFKGWEDLERKWIEETNKNPQKKNNR